ncbi:MAG: aminomethyl-transferring glycine dehydrogenase subunit GcvPA [Bacteroidaceae bacterium]|nr:aminomethyl-transferring glycine dehydrogenase subunit GcvPA [Bacteroidaceae bacterium]
MFKYFPHTTDDIQQMLGVIGVKSLDDLYAEIPEELKLHRQLDIPLQKSEIEVRNIIQGLAEKNCRLTCFAGSGVYDHYIPSLVPYLASRSEFSTSYTPYQAEISQGTLLYIFEYQTMMARLTGMDLSNASMYDGSTATAETMMMCVSAAKKRNRVLISGTFNENILQVVRTYAKFHGVDLVEVPHKDGVMDQQAAKELIESDDVAGLIVVQPNRYGLIEDFTGLADFCHEHNTLLAINTVASALGVLKSPGEWGADIACGDAQSLGVPMGYGGPYIGYLCTRNTLVRKMPGRLVGATTDADGKRAFVLTMQAREQHIRREKATSNICTAQGFMCLYIACYLSLMGPTGLKQVNQQSYKAAHYMHDELIKSGKFAEVFPNKPFLNEFTLRYTGNDDIRSRMAEAGILFGVPTQNMDKCITIACTEKNTREQIESVINQL